MQDKKSSLKYFGKLGRDTGVALLLACVSSAALAVPVTYTFTTNAGPVGLPSAALTALAGLSVSGSFTYDADGALVIAGTTGALYQGFSSLSGSVGGYSFSDGSGTVGLQNDSYTPPNPVAGAPFDLLQLAADPGLGSSGNYNLSGFTVPGLTLANVRLFWIENLIGNAPDFLSDINLPTAPPTFTGRLALDFVASPYTPVDGQPSPTLPALSIVFFDGLSVAPAPVSVPEPESLSLLAFGMLGLAAAMRRRLAA